MVFGFPPLVGRTRRKPPAEVRLGGAVRRLQAARCGWHSPAALDGSTWQRGPGGSTGSGVERNGLCGQKTGIQDLTARVSLQAGPLRAHAPIPQGFPSFGKTANCFF